MEAIVPIVQNLSIWKTLNARRRELGMSYAVLAQKSGVSQPTVVRILSGNQAASFANVAAIADALGLCLQVHPTVKAEELKERQARRKAKRLIRLLQGTSGLEGQALDAADLESLERQTVHELLAGSKRRLWDE